MDNKLTLSEYLGRVSQTIKSSFSAPAWVSCEVVSVRKHGSGHVYFELAEYDASGKEMAKVKATLWARQATEVLGRFAQATGGPLRDGIKILAAVLPSLHPQFGFSLSIQNIDPAFTLGDLEAKMAMIRETLQNEGIHERNKTYQVPFDFFSVVVVSPADAAGLGDFRREADLLCAYGLVQFHYVTALFQGAGTAGSLSAAIAEAGKLAIDTGSQAIIVIRGGGAKTDLAYVNELPIARALCFSPVPVMVGIGHERDTTILDELALMRFDTPSKVIGYILATVCKNAGEIDQNTVSIQISAQKVLATHIETLNAGIRSVVDLAHRYFEQEILVLKTSLRQSFDFAGVLLDRARQEIDRDMEVVTGLHPRRILKQGFAIVRKGLGSNPGTICKSGDLLPGSEITVQFIDGTVEANVLRTYPNESTEHHRI